MKNTFSYSREQYQNPDLLRIQGSRILGRIEEEKFPHQLSQNNKIITSKKNILG